MRKRLVGIALLSALLLAVLLWPERVVPEEGPRPSATRAGDGYLRSVRRSSSSDVPSPQPEAPKPVAQAEVIVHLGQWADYQSEAPLYMALDVAEFWPDLDEAPLPEDDDVVALVELIFTEQPDDAQLAAVLSQTAHRRTGRLSDDPWETLVQLHVEHIHAAQDREDERLDFLDRHDLTPDSYRDHLGELDEAYPMAVDHTVLLEMATETIATWPDHPVAEYAHLYRMAALSDEHSTVHSMAGLAEEFSTIFLESDDPFLLTRAAFMMDQMEDELCGLADRAMLEKASVIAADLSAMVETIGLYRSLIDLSLCLGEEAMAEEWMANYHRNAEQLCAMLEGQDGGDYFCSMFRSTVERRMSYLSAHGIGEALTWRSAVAMIAHRCDADGHALEAPLQGSGRWEDGGWQWSGWSEASGFSDCIQDTPHEGPPPPEGLQVTLSVFPMP